MHSKDGSASKLQYNIVIKYQKIKIVSMEIVYVILLFALRLKNISVIKGNISLHLRKKTLIESVIGVNMTGLFVYQQPNY